MTNEKIEAADKKVPFTLFAKFISNDLYRKSNVTNKDIQESIKKTVIYLLTVSRLELLYHHYSIDIG